MSQLISARDLINLQTAHIILDCRADLAQPDSVDTLFLQGHIPGAQQAHLERDLSGAIIAGATGRHPLPKIADFQQRLRTWGIEHNSHVIVYDQNNGMYAARAWWLLKWAGVEKVQLLNGGLDQWQAEGGELATFTPAVKTSNICIQTNDDWIVSAEQLTSLTTQQSLLDARALPRYRGEVEPIDGKAGHIPGAQNADFMANLQADGRFKNSSELAARFASLNGQEVICYCGSGVTACHNILAIVETGLSMPKLYPGSWSEWIIEDHRPVATGVEGDIL